MRRRDVVGLLLGCLLGCPLACGQEDPSFREILSRLAPKTPAEALRAFEVRTGFRVELVCCEPLVSDPIAIDWGPDGRLWVVEMGDYPQGEDGADTSGRIRYLEDGDGDGQYDRSTVFLADLQFPTGVMAWRQGVLVACAPDIFYAEDTDGDGRADRRQTLYTGFLPGNPQHRVNSLQWGLDNWIYAANGDNGGIVRSLRTGQRLDIHGRDVRIRPDTGALDTATGMSQFGRFRDDWGNWFGGRNLQPIWHCVLPDHYLRRNPYLVPPDPCVDLTDPPTCPPVYPLSAPLPRFNELWTMNRITSACGPTIYRDTLFGPEFQHSCFICEPAHNLVYHGMLEPDGVTFRCRRAPQQQRSEFLASRDHWFRPTQARTGPDGCLWVVDMYRLVIEHPDYIPKKWHDQLDYRAGRRQGRIYRVVPTDRTARRSPRLDRLSTPRLVAALDHPNGTLRDLVQRMLIHRNDTAAIQPLRKLAASSSRPATRLAALCTLDGLDQADPSTVVAATSDPHPGVRRHAVRISERHLDDRPALQQAVLERLEDTDPQVCLQVAFSLGQWNDPRAGRALARLLLRHGTDRFVVAAVLSSAGQYPGELMEALLNGEAMAAGQIPVLRQLLRMCLESGEDAALARGLTRMAARAGPDFQPWQFHLLADFCDSVQAAGESLAILREFGSADLQAAIERLEPLFEQATTLAIDTHAAVDLRMHAVRLAGRRSDQTGRAAREIEQLGGLLTPHTPTALQQVILDHLGKLAPDALPAILLEGWSHHGPELRPRILEILLSRKRWTEALLDAMERGDILPREVGATHRSKLLLSGAGDIAHRAAKLFQTTASEQRQDVIEHFRDTLDGTGDRRRGRTVFVAHCATCHQLEGEGTNIGPDLLSLTDRSTDALLVALLDPNRALQPRYVEYAALTMQGHTVTGIVTRETGNSITLVDAQGREHVLLRSDLDILRSSGRSLMPEGIEKLFERSSDVRDLMAYLQSVEPDRAEGEARQKSRLPPDQPSAAERRADPREP